MAYALMAGPDPLDANTSFQPKDVGGAYLNGSAKGFRIGIYKPFFEHATADIVSKCYESIDILRDAGAEIVEIEIPNLEEIRIAHMVTIASEMRSSMGLQLERDPTVFGLMCERTWLSPSISGPMTTSEASGSERRRLNH